MKFSADQIKRYHRHILLSEVGLEGQKKLSHAKILVVGAGGLGSPILLYLAAAGVGTLGITDADKVDLTNLQRQVIHFTADVDKSKVKSAKDKINQLNPDVNVKIYEMMVNSHNIADLIKDYDFIIDCTDNFEAKFLINDACVLSGKPFSHGGISQFVGQTMTVLPGDSACYRCVFHDPPPPDAIPSPSQQGLLGAIPGVLGTIQAVEALKYVIRQGALLVNRLLIFDGLSLEFRNVDVKKRKTCQVCGETPHKHPNS